MAETHPKRHRDDAADHHHYSEVETTKRHRNSYINEQQETSQDLFDFFTNLSSDPLLDFVQHPQPDPDNETTSNPKEESVDDDDEKERVIRHLLEASDDELGIPSRVEGGGADGVGGGGEVENDGGVGYEDFSEVLCDGLWELEDEAANYYTMLQSELFMQ